PEPIWLVGVRMSWVRNKRSIGGKVFVVGRIYHIVRQAAEGDGRSGRFIVHAVNLNKSRMGVVLDKGVDNVVLEGIHNEREELAVLVVRRSRIWAIHLQT